MNADNLKIFLFCLSLYSGTGICTLRESCYLSPFAAGDELFPCLWVGIMDLEEIKLIENASFSHSFLVGVGWSVCLCACGESVGDTNTFFLWKLNVRQNRLFQDFIDVCVMWDPRNERACVCACAHVLS